MDNTATVVLVHGAWHGAWCWDRVTALLDARGVPAIAVDLPGHGGNPQPSTGLDGDAAHLRDVLDDCPGAVVLCGHSYGGVVITAAGLHPAVGHLVYLAAFMPREGQSAASLLASASERGDLGPAIELHDDGTSTLVLSRAPLVLYGDCPPDDVGWALERLDPQSGTTLGQAPTEIAWRERPSTYVVCTEDRAIPPALQRRMAAEADEVLEWPTSHSPFLSEPGRVAELLGGIAEGVVRAS